MPDRRRLVAPNAWWDLMESLKKLSQASDCLTDQAHERRCYGRCVEINSICIFVVNRPYVSLYVDHYFPFIRLKLCDAPYLGSDSRVYYGGRRCRRTSRPGRAEG